IQLEQSIFSGGKLGFDGSVGTGTTTPSAILRTSYKHRMDNGSEPKIAMTMGDFLELNYGSELQAIQFLGTATAFRPFGTADLHLGKNTIVEYRYQSSVPNMRYAKGFESAPMDLSESGPRVSLTN